MESEKINKQTKHKKINKANALIASAIIGSILNIGEMKAESLKTPKDSLPSKTIGLVEKTELDTLFQQYKINGMDVKYFKNNTLTGAVKMDGEDFLMNISFIKKGEKYINPKIMGMASWFFDLEVRENEINIVPGKIQAVDSLQWMKLSKEVWKLNDKIMNIQLPEGFTKKEYNPDAKFSDLPIIFDDKEPFNVHLQIKKDTNIYKIHFNKSGDLLPNQTIIVDSNFYSIQQKDSALILEKSRYYNDEKNNRIYGTYKDGTRFEISLNEENGIDLQKIANTNPNKYKQGNELVISEDLLKTFQTYQKLKQATIVRTIKKTGQQRSVQRKSCEPQEDGKILLILEDKGNEKEYSITFNKDGTPISPMRIEGSLYLVRFKNGEIIIGG